LGRLIADAKEVKRPEVGLGKAVEPGFLEAPCSAPLIDRHHAVRLRMEETGMDGTGGSTAGEKGHEAFKVTMDGSKFSRPLLLIPALIAQEGSMRQENPIVIVRVHSYSFLE
jgi:hypothetical protein